MSYSSGEVCPHRLIATRWPIATSSPSPMPADCRKSRSAGLRRRTSETRASSVGSCCPYHSEAAIAWITWPHVVLKKSATRCVMKTPPSWMCRPRRTKVLELVGGELVAQERDGFVDYEGRWSAVVLDPGPDQALDLREETSAML